MTIEFEAWPKIPRLNRDITITEKIDGTNAAIGIAPLHEVIDLTAEMPAYVLGTANSHEYGRCAIWAQSRKRLIGIDTDNHNFAHWVAEFFVDLIDVLGPGLHFGEWWGSGIQRGYGLEKGEKRFSLFNTKRWTTVDETDGLHYPNPELHNVPGLTTVPVLYEGPFAPGGSKPWVDALYELEIHGSQAAPGFDDPEGVIIFHHAANHCFKVTIRGDEAPKGHNEH